MAEPGEVICEFVGWEPGAGSWPTAAAREGEGIVVPVKLSEFPVNAPYRHLLDVVDVDRAEPLSLRAANGFSSRLHQGNLGQYPGFRADVREYVDFLRHGGTLAEDLLTDIA